MSLNRDEVVRVRPELSLICATYLLPPHKFKMEFTDPIVAQEELPDHKAVNEEGNTNEKTQKAIHRLEEDIEVAYSTIETKFSSLWANASESAQGLQEKMKLEDRRKEIVSQITAAKNNINNNKMVQANIQSAEKQLKDLGDHIKSLESSIDVKSISSQANKALDSLDSKLEIVEQQAGRFVSLFASFFSNIVSIDSPKDSSKKEPETIFSNSGIPGAAYNSTRFETDLFKLHTSEHFYLDDSDDSTNDDGYFDIEEKTLEISNLLKKYPDTLEKLMNKLVPVEISYSKFWERYFKQELKLKENDQKRKELLSSESEVKAKLSLENASDDDDEDFTWDDDDEDEEKNEEVSKHANTTNDDEEDNTSYQEEDSAENLDDDVVKIDDVASDNNLSGENN